jgi:predicted PurR-regulated permease PerM
MIIMVTLVLVQLLDNVIIQPLCFSKTVDMHPVTVIIVLIIGNSLMGIAGMLLAIPLATILMVSAVETYWGLKNYQITA